MPTPATVESDLELPTRADTVIIGGGIAGIIAALELAERGQQVVVCEKGVIAGEQSSRNWGWCRQMGRDPRELPLSRISMDLWRAMRQRTGEETGFRESGVSYLCDTEEKLEQRRMWFEAHGGTHGLSTHMIGADEAAALTPGSTVRWVGGMHSPEDGRAEPTLAVPAMARAAQHAGARIFQNCAVRGLERQAGKVCGVVTELGPVACESVVLAGGAWSRRFCHNMGVRLPQLSVIGSVLRTGPIDAGVESCVAAAEFAVRKRLDGGYTIAQPGENMADIVPDSFRLLRDFWPVVKNDWREYQLRIGKRFIEEAQIKRRWALDEISPFEKVRVLSPQPVKKTIDSALHSVGETLPVFKNATIEESWGGFIDVTPDIIPVISGVHSLPGFYMATGFSGHGFGLGPGAGKLMAQIVTGEKPCVDPAPFRLERFRMA